MTEIGRERMYEQWNGRISRTTIMLSAWSPGASFGARDGWFLIAQHALPDEWRGRAIPVYLLRLHADEVEAFSPPRDGPIALDSEERAVARLVARGVSPREIAATLHLSRRSVFRRLARLRHLHGAATNTELATKLAKQDI